jgi:hypothetical protein
MHTKSVRELAIQLRTQGYSYPYISKATHISKSTLSGWLAEVPYVPNAVTIESFGKARAIAGQKKAEKKQQELQHIRKTARAEIGSVSERDLLLFGLGIYLGEGSKTHNVTRITNSDPNIIRSALAWFRMLGVTKKQLAPRIHLYPDSNEETCLLFWSRTTNIPVSQFQKSQIDRRTGKKSKKKGKTPYGTLHVGVRSCGKKEHGVFFFRKIQAWNEAVVKEIS